MQIKSPQLLLCTDMDRTVIPNGRQPESPLARECFSLFCRQPEVTLVYVTGRCQELVRQAINEYNLPQPDYAITDVGTKIYQVTTGRFQTLESWELKIAKTWRRKSHTDIALLFRDITHLTLQEPNKQNTHKLSFYVSLTTDHEQLIAEMSNRLDLAGVEANLVWSVDELKDIGLLDVLPGHATKRDAVDFLRCQLGYALHEVVFAGDSGNDLPVLASTIPSVLVANATPDIRAQSRQQAATNNNSSALYTASGKNSNMNGNYVAGVLEGVWHFAPKFHQYLENTGFFHE